jgi:hypothetical protein
MGGVVRGGDEELLRVKALLSSWGGSMSDRDPPEVGSLVRELFGALSALIATGLAAVSEDDWLDLLPMAREARRHSG